MILMITRPIQIEFKGLRAILEGLVVTVHEGACETVSPIHPSPTPHPHPHPRPFGLGIGRTVRTRPGANEYIF